MGQTVSVIVTAENRERLAAIIVDRNRPRKHLQRARIVLLSADRLPAAEIARQAGVSRPSVWRWQRRWGESGIDVLLREPSRKPGKPPLPASTVNKIVALTCTEPPGQVTHWTGRAMAEAVGIEQLLEAANDINQGADLGTTLTGAGVNTTLVIGTSITLTSLAESGAIGFVSGSDVPIVGNLAGLAGGIGVELMLGSPAQTGQALSQSFSNGIAIEQTNAAYGTGFYYPGG